VRQFDVPVNDTKLKSARQAFIKKAAELKKQPAPEAAMETFQGAVGGAAAAATSTAIGSGGAMMTGATMGQAVGMMGGPMGMMVGAVGGALIGAAIGGSGLLYEDDMAAAQTVPSEALNPEETKVGKPLVKEIEKMKAEKDVQPSPAQLKTQQAEAFGSELPLPVIAGVRAEEEEEWGLLQKYGFDPAKPPPNSPPPAASAAAGAGTAAARSPKSPPGAAAAAPQHAGAAQTPPKLLAAGRAGSNSPTEEATENVAAASLSHTARTDRSADFLDDLKEAEAKYDAKAKTKSVKVATSATKKAGKEPATAKKKTPVTAVTACSKQSSAAP
jgi:hypothetical protein